MAAEEQPALLAYLASEGKPEDRQQLIAGKFWNRKMQDGRSDEAMLELIEAIRVMRRTGAKISVFAMDMNDSQYPVALSSNEPYWQGQRDLLMAANAETRFHQYPASTFLLLVGNYHSDKVADTQGDDVRHPMAELLSHHMPVQNIDFSTAGGEAWICGGPSPEKAVCGPHTRRAQSSMSGSDYDFVIPLGRITASPPAAEAAGK
ncbi:hypothetical protein ACO0LO_16555 [Undibacterium sp. TJN25]|uniref:hypothetical protein n=1 Tax=Undibacterium sp. TJN25 TaxID=3413056 RepID=UPI003BF35853